MVRDHSQRPSDGPGEAAPRGALLVYAVVAAGDGAWQPLPPGVGGWSVHRVVAGDLAAAVSHLDPGHETPDVPRALQYAAVVAALHAAHTVVPMRYGCVVADVAELAVWLARRRDDYRHLLASVAGCAEMAVRLVVDTPGGGGPSNGSGHASVSGAGCGASYLRQRQAAYAAVDREQHGLAAAEAALRDAVAGFVVATRVDPRRQRTPAGLYARAVAFLVKREAVAEFRAAVARVRATSGARLRVSGPWPPYTFVTADRSALAQ